MSADKTGTSSGFNLSSTKEDLLVFSPGRPKSSGSAASNEWPMKASDYVLRRRIGVAQNSTIIWSATCAPLNENVSIKIVDLELVDPAAVADGLRKSVAGTDHPNVHRHYTSFLNGNELWIVSELTEGSVEDFIRTMFKSGLSDHETVIGAVLAQVLVALCFFHSYQLVHRDIRARHIHLTEDGVAMLTDLSKSFCVEHKRAQTLVPGSLLWTAPEAMGVVVNSWEAAQGYGCSADIWSFGITALEIALGEPPFSGDESRNIISLVERLPAPTLPPAVAGKFSKHFKDMVALCLQKDPALRPTAAKLREHAFFKPYLKRPKKSLEILARWVQEANTACPMAKRVDILYPEFAVESAVDIAGTLPGAGDEDFDFATSPRDTSRSGSGSDGSESGGDDNDNDNDNGNDNDNNSNNNSNNGSGGDDSNNDVAKGNNNTPERAIPPTQAPAVATTAPPSSGAANPAAEEPYQQLSSSMTTLPTVAASSSTAMLVDDIKKTGGDLLRTVHGLTAPVDTVLAETSTTYYVYIRTLSNTMLSFKIRGRDLILDGRLPDMPLSSGGADGIVFVSGTPRQFSHTITFPEEINADQATRKLVDKVLVISVQKTVPTRSLGEMLSP